MTHNRRAVWIMLASAFCYSFIPLVIVWSGGGDEPFLFSVGWRVGVTAGYLAFLVTWYRRLVTDRRIMGIVLRRVVSWSIVWVAVSNFEIVLYAVSTRFIDISVAAVLFELGPVVEIIFMDRILRTTGVYRALRPSTLVMIAFCFVGVAFLVAGQHGGFALWEGSTSGSLFSLLGGVVLAFFGVVALALVALGYKWGFRLSAELRASGVEGFSEFSLSLFCILMALLIGNLVSIPVNTAIGLALGESLGWNAFGLIVIGGIVVNALGSILARMSILQTDDLGVNVLGYATPVLALGWLFLFAEVDVAKVEYLVIGTVAILSANLLMNFEAETRMGFKSLVVAFWVCGTWVYVRDDLLGEVFPGGWFWPGMSYFQALALSATVFTLILSFRVARLADRTRDEDRQIFDLGQRFEVLLSRNVVNGGVLEHLGNIDSARNTKDLQVSYREARILLVRVERENLAAEDLKYLAETEAKLNELAYSRHQGIEFGELFALMAFGGVTVLLALVSRPPVSGWTGLLVDLLSILFSAVVFFLMANVFDLQRDRYARILSNVPELGGLVVAFRDTENRSLEQWLSVFVGFGVGAAFVGLLWYKWMV